jgi:hypothetical protein
MTPAGDGQLTGIDTSTPAVVLKLDPNVFTTAASA